MSFCRSKIFWVTVAIFFPLLVATSRYGFKVMTSVYKTDMGNGVVIYADDFVKTGRWVFHCGRSRLISREPLPIPTADLELTNKLTIGKMYALGSADEKIAKVVARAITTTPGWYKSLSYRYSILSENSDLNSHIFGMLAIHYGRKWVLKVWQWIDSKSASSFEVTAEPYNPETYVDYARELQVAVKSCPVLQ